MPQCSLGEEGAVAIADFVKKAKKLQELNLYMNDIGNGGAYKVTTHPVINLLTVYVVSALPGGAGISSQSSHQQHVHTALVTCKSTNNKPTIIT
jgi:hypothetical protein